MKAVKDKSANSAELMVLYCERAAGLNAEVDVDDAVYLDALVSMFGQALTAIAIASLPVAMQGAMVNRLEKVQRIARDLGYGVGEGLDTLWSDHGRA